jgi:hypothetical protein
MITNTTTKTLSIPKLKKENIPLNKYIAIGNHKLPRSTAIFNMGAAKNCPSLALGLCQAYSNGKLVCYAMKAEAQYPNVLPYRHRQESFWKNITAESFAKQFILIQSLKRNKFTALRINEAGDFWSQDCVDKADKIAQLLEAEGVTVYCYTARQDLDFSRVQSLIINGSGFKKEGIVNEFKMVERAEDRPQGYGICYGDCRVCHRCLYRGKNTVVVKH